MDFNSFLTSKIKEKGLISDKDFDSVQQLVNKEQPLVDVLVEQGLISEDVALSFFSEYFGIPSINLHHYTPEDEAIDVIPIQLCEKFTIFPIFKMRNTLMIATANPSDIHALDEIRVKTGYGIDPVLALSSSIRNAINQYYSVGDSVSNVIETISEDAESLHETEEEKSLVEAASDEPVVKLVNLFITQALRDRASDVHINPEKEKLRVRYRIDGVLHEVAQPPKKLQAAIISRIKILSSLDISERRRPQDGRIELRVEGKSIDLRVSTFPTIYGENIVMRILNKGSVLLGLDEIGFEPEDKQKFTDVIRKPYGIILATGPTGSGKTTTLYSALSTINSLDKNIITLEDPVEYNLPLVRQGQINLKTNFTFANGLRSILRQDPDVILVGEIRDEETAAIAVQAALTGHLVFSTLHTNDAPSTVIRLIEMGIDPFLISSTVICTMAQRLVRLICERCKKEYEPEEDLLRGVGLEKSTNITYYKGDGCNDCRNTGFRGRIGLYELMLISPTVQKAIVEKISEMELRRLARNEGMKTLREDGIVKIKKGLTTIDEVLRVTAV